MLYFYKFRSEVPSPTPARGAYAKQAPGKGWPEECPPMRAANAFGWDVLAAHDMTFRQRDGQWTHENPVDLESDWVFDNDEEDRQGAPLVQRNAWFWDKDQVLPHVISPEVYPQIANQVKVSTYLFLQTDPNELLFMTEVPNRRGSFRTLSAVLDTDWYPASYPWHCVIELDRAEKEVHIEKGEPICRLFPVRRDHYFARELSTQEFESYFRRTQDWLMRNGKGETEGMTDITGAYVKGQQLSKFSVVL
jgi:hypothetical protein